MEEQKDKRIPEAGLSEALHPEIGNGAALAGSDHDFVLRMPDVTKSLEHMLVRSASDEVKPKEESPIPAASAEASSPAKTVTPEESVAEESKSPDTGTSQKPSTAPVRKKTVKAKKAADTPATKEKSSDKPKKKSRKKAASPAETDKPKAPKPGKRILKAAKAVKKQQKKKKATAAGQKAAKPTGSKTTAKKAPVKKKTVQKKTAQKKVVKKAAPKKAVPSTPAASAMPISKGQLREQPVLSAFTQWLKELGGAEYVHPYEDDFALHPEKGTLKEVISETYADLLASQGYKDRAEEMYRKLMEKYPEKSSFFAAKIEALQ